MRRVSLAVLIVLVALLTATIGAAEVGAQTPVPSPTPASTRLCWDHDGINLDRFDLAIDSGAASSVGKPTPVGQMYCVPFPALTPGTHTLVVCAVNVAGQSCADPFEVNVVVVPTKPTNVRFVSGGE